MVSVPVILVPLKLPPVIFPAELINPPVTIFPLDTLPVTLKLVPVAAPMLGVTRLAPGPKVPTDESAPLIVPDPLNPRYSYGGQKLASELIALNYGRTGFRRVAVFRPHNVYGERQNIGDKYRNVVGIFMNQLLQGKPMSVFGDGSQTRAFSYIGEVAPIIAESIEIGRAHV